MNFARLINGCGGMPSSHTSFSSSVTMLIGFEMGFDTPLFAACLIFTFITAYDAMGLRWESGKQAEVINNTLGTNLKEPLGHKPIETLIGVLFGIVLSILLNKIK